MAISAEIDSPTPMISAWLGEADLGPRPSTSPTQLTWVTTTLHLAVAEL